MLLCVNLSVPCFPLAVFAAAKTEIQSSSIVIAPLSLAESRFAKSQLKSSKPLLIVAEGAPPGFEDLEEQQKGLVDVYNGGKFLLAAPAIFTNETIAFLNPSAVIEKVPYLLDPEKVLKLLTDELPANSGYICRQRREKNCGQLPVNETGVIFDVGRHRADLFVAENLLTRKRAKAKFLPPSSAGLSFVMPFNLSVSDSTNDNSIFSLNGETLVSRGNSHLESRWNYSEDVGFLAHNLSLRRDSEGREAQVGIFDTRGFGAGFISDQLIAGSRYASTTRTRTDRSVASGSMLSVLLNSRSRVAVIRNGRVLTSTMYDSGNQIIDTSLLPDGAYDVVLRIEDSSGEVREEKRFFSKSQSLSPNDQPLYFVEGGNMLFEDEQILPQTSEHWLMRGGYMDRLMGNLGASVVAAATFDQSLLQAGSVYMTKYFKFDVTALVTSTSDTGFSVSAQTFFDWFSIYARAEQVNIQSGMEGNSLQAEEYRLINSDREEYVVRLSVPFFASHLDFSYNMRRRDDNEFSSFEKDWSAQINYPLLNSSTHRLNFVSHYYSYDTREDDAFVGLEYHYTLPTWLHEVKYGARSSGYGDNDSATTMPLRIKSTWRDRRRTGQDTEAYVYLDDGVEVDTTTLGAAVDYGFNGGRVRASADHQRHNGEGRENFSRYSLNFNSHIAGDLDGVSWGGARRQRSAVIINIHSLEETDEHFEIFVNNQQRGYADVNESTLLSLLAYESYDIAIYPPPGASYSYQTGRKSLTVYPGNTKTIDWQVAKMHTVFGQVTDVQGGPVINAYIQESDLYEGSDDYGIFQVDIPGNIHELTFKNDSVTCKVKLPDYDKTKFVAALGALVCRKEGEDAGRDGR